VEEKKTPMGLKDPKAWKTFLERLFPDCTLKTPEQFKEVIESVDVAMYDINIITHNECGSSYSKESLDRKLQNFFKTQFSVFVNAKRIIGTMDDSKHVPKAKKFEQMERDKKNEASGLIFTDEQLSALGDYAFMTKWDRDEYAMDAIESALRDSFDIKTAEKEARRKFRKIKRGDISSLPTQEEQEKTERDGLFVFFLERVLHTRSTRSDLLYYVTKKLLQITIPLIHGREIIIDGALYAKEPKHTEMIDGNYNTSSVIHVSEDDVYGDFYPCQISPCLMKKVADYDGRNTKNVQMSEYETKMVGEGDIKAGYWISVCAKEKKSIYFQCSDTDLIVIILILFKCMDANGESIPELYLDVTCTRNIPDRDSIDDGDPESYYKKMSEARRTYSMHLLYFTLKERLGEMWPEVSDPVLTFCLAAMSNGTDFFTSPSHIGIGTITKAVLCGGYVLLDKAIRLSFIKPEDGGDMVPTAVINEQRLMEFWKYCYSVLKLSHLKKDKSIDSSSLESIIHQVNTARLVLWPTATEKKKGQDQDAYKTITGVRFQRVDLVHKSFSELVEFTEKDPDDPNGDTRKPHDLIKDQLTLPWKREELFKTIKKNFIHGDEKMMSYWKGKQKPDTEDKLYASARRWAWNLLYWVFSYRCSFSDVSMMENRFGLSHFGYREEIDHLTGSSMVQYTDHVFSV